MVRVLQFKVRPRSGGGRPDRRVGGPRVRGLPQEGQIRIHTVRLQKLT